MKMAMIRYLKLFSKFFIILCVLGALLSCSASYTGREYNKGKKALAAGRYSKAVEHFKRVIKREPDSDLALQAARQAAKASFFETKNFSEAVLYYQHIVKYSPKDSERRESQKTIANIFFEKLNDYARSIEEYNKLLLLRNSNEEAVEYKFYLAKAHFNLNHFFEAETEALGALKTVENPERKFDIQMFLGSIYFNTKRVDNAIKTYENLIASYPERAKKENVAMNIIVCYEEAEAFDKAIAKLQEMREGYADVEFIDLKIKRLRDRKANLPGSRGLRK